MPGKPSILIVDPSPEGAGLFRGLLGGPYELLEAQDFASGLETVRRAAPDLVVLDAGLSGMDVLEAGRMLRRECAGRETPLLLCGTREAEEDEARALEAGFTDFLPRPLRPSVIRARIRQHLEIGQYRAIVNQVSWIDPVTGMPNEAHMEEQLLVEWRRAARNRTSLALLLVTLDHFEAYQQSHGRHAAEECQRRLAAVFVKGIQRAGDLMGRYGGTGFISILPETDNIGAVSVSERFRAEVYTAAIPNPHSRIGILTASLGVASLVPTRGDMLTDLKIATEEALNRAILRGGNQVVFS
nr:diguanylate cyclase [uncultured Holophaga sp.]